MGGSSPGGNERSYGLHNRPYRLSCPSSLLFKGYWCKAVGSVKLTTRFHLMSRLGMSGTVPVLPMLALQSRAGKNNLHFFADFLSVSCDFIVLDTFIAFSYWSTSRRCVCCSVRCKYISCTGSADKTGSTSRSSHSITLHAFTLKFGIILVLHTPAVDRPGQDCTNCFRYTGTCPAHCSSRGNSRGITKAI